MAGKHEFASWLSANEEGVEGLESMYDEGVEGSDGDRGDSVEYRFFAG